MLGDCARWSGRWSSTGGGAGAGSAGGGAAAPLAEATWPPPEACRGTKTVVPDGGGAITGALMSGPAPAGAGPVTAWGAASGVRRMPYAGGFWPSAGRAAGTCAATAAGDGGPAVSCGAGARALIGCAAPTGSRARSGAEHAAIPTAAEAMATNDTHLRTTAPISLADARNLANPVRETAEPPVSRPRFHPTSGRRASVAAYRSRTRGAAGDGTRRGTDGRVFVPHVRRGRRRPDHRRRTRGGADRAR